MRFFQEKCWINQIPFHNPKLALVMFWEKAKECNRKNGYAKYVCTFAPQSTCLNNRRRLFRREIVNDLANNYQGEESHIMGNDDNYIS